MSIYHKDKCSKIEIKDFRNKVVKFLELEGIKPYKIKALRSYEGEIRLYKAELLYKLRLKLGRKLVAFKNPDGSYEGETDAVEMLKRSGGDQLYETTNAPIPVTNYTQVFRVDDWEEEIKAIREFFKKERKEGRQNEC